MAKSKRIRKRLVPMGVTLAKNDICFLCGVPRRSLNSLLNRLYWGRRAPMKFAQYCKLETPTTEMVSRFEEAIVLLADWSYSTVQEFTALLGRYFYWRKEHRHCVEQMGRGMEGCFFLWVQRKEALLKTYVKSPGNFSVVLPEPRYHCLAKSVLSQRLVPCDRPIDKRGDQCEVYHAQMRAMPT